MCNLHQTPSLIGKQIQDQVNTNLNARTTTPICTSKSLHSLSLFQSFNKSNNFLWRKLMHDFLSWFVSFFYIFPKQRPNEKWIVFRQTYQHFIVTDMIYFYPSYSVSPFKSTAGHELFLSHPIRVSWLLFTIYRPHSHNRKRMRETDVIKC